MTADPTSIWVRSEVLPDGSYTIGFNIGPDLAWTLPPRAATAYAVACITLSMAADHDAAVLRQLTQGAQLSLADSARFLHEAVRSPRSARRPCSGPLQFEAGLRMDGKPFIASTVNGRPLGQLSPADLRGHASNVLTVVAAVDLDSNLHHALTRRMELDDPTARAFITTLPEFWPPTVWPEPETPETPR